MRPLATLLVPAALAAAALAAAAPASADLRLGLDSAPYPPFYQKDPSGKFVGWEVEIGDAMCAVMEEKCEWVGIAWDGIIPALLANKIDAIVASMSITEEREKTIDFSDRYYNTPAVIIAAKSSAIDGSPESVEGKIIGVQVSTTHQNYAQEHFADVADSIKTYQAFDEQNQDLVSGRVDAVVGDSLAFQPFLKSPAGQDYEVKGTLEDIAIFGPGVGVGLRKGEDELRERFNDAIAKIRADGTYDEISKKYFDFDIYGTIE